MAVALISDALRRRERALARASDIPSVVAQSAAVAGDQKDALIQLLEAMTEQVKALRAEAAVLRASVAAVRGDGAAQAKELAQAIETGNVAIQATMSELKHIREPGAQMAATPPVAPQPAAMPAAVPPDPAKTWHMHVMARDPNGAIQHIRWTPQD